MSHVLCVISHVSHVFTGAQNTVPVFTAREHCPCSWVVRRLKMLCTPVSTAGIHGPCSQYSVYTTLVYGPWSQVVCTEP